ncbi:hypothetical protein LMZ02_28340 [Paenibacillus macerans]|nr:hypothetical protein [Paenibacillus macerans]UMV47319.1 hypothetical protein LMZ02_28340 [Paenibacillus macerans]
MIFSIRFCSNGTAQQENIFNDEERLMDSGDSYTFAGKSGDVTEEEAYIKFSGFAGYFMASRGQKPWHSSWHFISNNLAETKDLVLRPMFIGAVFMLLFGLIKDGIPDISLKLALILFWLGSINGALALYTISPSAKKEEKGCRHRAINLVKIPPVQARLGLRPHTMK